jgi:hypothetical protein
MMRQSGDAYSGKTAENSERNSGLLAVLWLAESPGVQDFCGGRDLGR